MAERNRLKRAQQIRSPRSAAFAGLIFSLLLLFQMVLAATISADALEIIDPELLDTWAWIVKTILAVSPFAGIAFLWFTGVIRDWFGDREDRFFSTVFFGSGIIYVTMIFVYAAVMGAVLRIYDVSSQINLDFDVVIFGFSLANEVLVNYALRMASVYMLSIGSLLTRTGQAPRWLVLLTFVIAIGMLLFAGYLRWARYLFPAWAIIISIYILVANYRGEDEAREQS